jgi:uncharacterized protein YjbJ (UPF0337 family)
VVTMNMGTIDISKLRGVGDKFVGLAKETTGVLIGNESLQRAGEAQQEKATEMLKALRDEAKAEASDARASSLPDTGGSGIFAEAKGKVKQTAANVTGDREMQKEGEADAERGAAERNATKSRVSAKAHEAKAKLSEKTEDAAEQTSD